MSQILTNFPYLPRWYYSDIFLSHVASWDDLRKFKVENFNFKQASLFFSEKRRDLSLNAFLERNMGYFGVVDNIRTFFMKKGLNFQKIEPNFYYEEAFSRYRYANIPFFWRFFNIWRAISQLSVNQFFHNFCQKYKLIPSNTVCGYKSIHAREHC